MGPSKFVMGGQEPFQTIPNEILLPTFVKEILFLRIGKNQEDACKNVIIPIK
jgi:hypothetical protein